MDLSTGNFTNYSLKPNIEHNIIRVINRNLYDSSMHFHKCVKEMAKQLYEITNREGILVELSVQEGSRHQFPKESFVLKDSL